MSRRKARYDPGLPLDDTFRNAGLFADHFLEHRLPELPEWQAAEDVVEVFSRVKALFETRAAQFTDDTNEAQTENDLIRPLLDILWGHECYQVQAEIPNPDARRVPDYAFFVSAEDRSEAESRAGTPEYWTDCPALGDAKRWASSLDRQVGPGENPSAQVANYLYRSRVRWGLLTNGRVWRLYEQDRSRAGGTYFEVNLEAVVRLNDEAAFRHFWLFFRREAHVRDESGKTFLDRVFEGSVAYATEVGDRLKDSVYDALRHLMNGFCEWPANQLDARDLETLPVVHENALIVLYRLLFALFAEDRGLLPCDDDQYEPGSLRQLHGEINRKLRNDRRKYTGGLRNLWNRVCENWRLIDEGLREGDEVTVPAYNGGLFSPEHHPHIAHSAQAGVPRWDISDRRLGQVVDLLAYERKRWDQPGTEDIDYETLAVQHLGSIYEGLLELQPAVADEDLVETSEKGRAVFRPAAEVAKPKAIKGQPPRRVAAGEVYLVTNRGERKATGSYYTPSYIVDYIVEHTVGPLADEAAERAATLAQRAAELESELKKASNPPAVIRQVRGEWEEVQRQRLEPYLSLKILDPAMGSGHFLVGAADFLSLAMATDPNLPEPENGEDEAQAYYKRLVVERCLYGVDLNPLAVELAKLSLWLHTVSRDKALSFLDHHLRCGNSLIGARIEEDLSREPPRLNAQGKRVNADDAQMVLGFTEALTGKHLDYLLTTLQQIMRGPSGSADDEHAKETLYAAVDQARGRFRQVAHCWTAPYFGASVAPEEYQAAVRALKAPEDSPAWQAVADAEWFRAAQEAANERRFFHWELEFPECFFDTGGLKAPDKRGFDAVVGNPPWLGLRTGVIDAEMVPALKDTFRACVGQFDLAALFLELSTTLAQRDGTVGMVVPKRIATNESFRLIRGLVAIDRRLDSIVDLGVAFEDVNNDVIMLVSAPCGTCESGDISIGVRHTGDVVVWQSLPSAIVGAMPFGIIPLNFDRDVLVAVLEVGSVPTSRLGEVAEITRGAECGMNHAAITETASPGSLAILDHLDACRYHVAHSGAYVDPSAMPKSVLKDRTVYTRVPKLLVRFLAAGLVVAKDDVGYASTNLLYHVHSDVDSDFLCALLCSHLLGTWYRQCFQNEEVKFPHVQKSHLVELPIRLPDRAHQTPGDGRDALAASARAALDAADWGSLESLAGRAIATHALLHGPAGRPELKVDPYWASVIATADPEFPGREDFVHDLLAMLAERMMELNRQKHGEVTKFLRWLEFGAGCKVDDLSGKTKVQAFYEDPAPKTVLDVLGKNKKKLGTQLNADLVAQVTREHEEAMGALGPILDALLKTDDLIDQIVYKLYGLTEEEIEMVRGAVGG